MKKTLIQTMLMTMIYQKKKRRKKGMSHVALKESTKVKVMSRNPRHLHSWYGSWWKIKNFIPTALVIFLEEKTTKRRLKDICRQNDPQYYGDYFRIVCSCRVTGMWILKWRDNTSMRLFKTISWNIISILFSFTIVVSLK